MLSEHAEAGKAGGLDGLSAAMEAVDLKQPDVRGDGSLLIDEDCRPPKMVWNPRRHGGFNFSSRDDDTLEATTRSLEKLNSQAIALRGSASSVIGTTSLRRSAAAPASDSEDMARHARAKHDSYLERMKLLQEEARHDGYTLNFASEIDFRQFIESAPNMRRGNLVLMDNGNLRAIWKDERGTHLGLQFLGGRMVQYVIFKQREQGPRISRVTGRDTLEGIEQQIGAFELHSLVYV